jgi:hypothetical protein
MFHDNFHDEALRSKIVVMIVKRRAPDKHVNDVRVIGAGYILIVVVCNSIYVPYIIHFLVRPICHIIFSLI